VNGPYTRMLCTGIPAVKEETVIVTETSKQVWGK
jgi:hypothetical protein